MALLAVDSGEVSSSALTERLSRHGFVVTATAGTGEAAAELEQRRYDLVLCPFAPGQPAGLGTLQNLARHEPAPPILLVTHGIPPASDLVAAMRLGVVDVLDLEQPFEFQLDVIEEAIRRLHGFAASAGKSVDRATSADLAVMAADYRRQAETQLRELERDQRAGRFIQLGMLPPSPMAIGSYRLRHKIIPSLLLSGDFVDYFRLTDHHFAFYMADVAGHGASSAFVTVLLKNFSRRLRREYRPSMLRAPGEILVWLNRELLDNELDKHVAIFIGVVDLNEDTLAYANAGHFPNAVLVDGEGSRTLEIVGKPVGLFREVIYASAEAPLHGACSVFLVSDGVLEVLEGEGLAAKERQLLDAAAQSHRSGDELWTTLGLAQQQLGRDDMACLAVSKEA